MSECAKISVHAVEGKSQITFISARIKSESLFNISLAILILTRMIKLTGAVTDKSSEYFSKCVSKTCTNDGFKVIRHFPLSSYLNKHIYFSRILYLMKDCESILEILRFVEQ